MLKKITSPEEYAELLKYFNEYHFSQSELFYKARLDTKVKVEALVFYPSETDQIPKAVFQAIENSTLRGRKFILIPFGPVLASDISKNELDVMIAEIKDYYSGYNNKPIFIQLDPFSMNESVNLRIGELLREIRDNNSYNLMVSKKSYRHADGTIYIDLDKAPEQLFEGFRKDMRYNIRKGEKDNELQFVTSRSKESYEQFWNMYVQTQRKKGFVDNRKELYRAFMNIGKAYVYEARTRVDDRLVACIYCIEYSEQKTLITFLSATTLEGNKMKAPTSLRWNLIKDACEEGYNRVDFFSMEKGEGGPSEFKKGFSGKVTWYSSSYDMVLKRFNYSLINLLMRLRK